MTLAAAVSALAAPALGEERPPNVLVILADDLGAKELGCYGNPAHRTPNLDALAAGGVRFRTCFATPLCTPSRVELLTGRYGFRTGWNGLIGRLFSPPPDSPQYDLGAAEVTFADVLAAKGYATGLAGKWQLPGKPPTLAHDCGFDEYSLWAFPEYLPPGVKHTGAYQKNGRIPSRYWHPAVVTNGSYVPTQPSDYGPDLFHAFVVDFMGRHADEPFLVHYPVLLPHDPHEPTPDPARPGQRTEPGLKASVEYLDHLVGELVAALDRLGLREDTIVLFTADNGTAGEGKEHATELGVRVPLIVHGPGRVRAGVVSDALVDLSDVLPTLAELAGARLPEERVLDGRSFAPVLRGDGSGPREWVFSSFRDQRVLRDGRWLLEGDGRFFDCGGQRDHAGYRDVTGSDEPDVLAARARFEDILGGLPAAKLEIGGGAKREQPGEDE
jgi:arylsulfatase A-like enzyme